MLNFEIDSSQIQALTDELEASEKQVRMAFNRALNRTAGTLRRMASTGLRTELQLRTAAAIRKRLKTIKLKRGKNTDDIVLWFGANDLPISAFKGRPRETASGAEFNGQQFDGAFIAKTSKGRQSIFKRKGRARLPIVEQTVPVADKIQVFVEDEIFTEVEAIFFKNFRAELRARTLYGVGNGR